MLVSSFQGMVQGRLLRHAIDRTQSRSLASNLHTESTKTFGPRVLSKYELEFPFVSLELQS